MLFKSWPLSGQGQRYENCSCCLLRACQIEAKSPHPKLLQRKNRRKHLVELQLLQAFLDSYFNKTLLFTMLFTRCSPLIFTGLCNARTKSIVIKSVLTHCTHKTHVNINKIKCFAQYFWGKRMVLVPFSQFFGCWFPLIVLTFPKFTLFQSLQGTAGSATRSPLCLWLKPQEHSPAGLDKLDVNF